MPASGEWDVADFRVLSDEDLRAMRLEQKLTYGRRAVEVVTYLTAQLGRLIKHDAPEGGEQSLGNSSGRRH